MLKKRNKKILWSLIGAGAVALTVVPLSVGLASCSSSGQTATTTEAQKDVSKFLTTQAFNGFLNNNHGRFAGNFSNFTNVKSDNTGLEGITGAFTNKDLEKHLAHPLTETIDPNKDNYGSYHAYLYLKNEIKQMGYQDNNPEGLVKYPAQGTVTEVAGQNGKMTKTYTAAQGTLENKEHGVTMRAEDSKDLKPMLKKDGFITQGFLWNGSDNANGIAGTTYNNVGNNLVVTINPTMAKADNATIKDVFIISHYDSTAYAESKDGTRHYGDIIKGHQSWGATDNGTGVSVNLALLKYYSQPENRNSLGVRLHIMFSDAEEEGVMGTYAFVTSFVKSNKTTEGVEQNELLKNTLSVINMDTVAGGDHTYIHARGGTAHKKMTLVRDQIEAVSQRRAKELNDPTQALEIHPALSRAESQDDSFLEAGETGDWSDHEPFYEQGVATAYFESTNFDIWSKNHMYDGYSQVKNPAAWILKNGEHVDLKQTKINGGVLSKYDWPAGHDKKSDWLLTGDIWHSDLDTPEFMIKTFGNRIFLQMDTVFHSLEAYLRTIYDFNPDNQTFTYMNQ
ncbi:M28 family peptidase [Ureaplasma ceti]|uniref:Peptidase M28 domain-containing protein n=1 Tax=Ureaplasma ceti TaxID=3119530 RepID=A0ABP9U6U4_9BACT